jgi:thymidylate kinase
MKINYSQVYGNEIDEVVKDNVELPRHFSDLSPEIQRLFEVAVDAGYQRALEDALDPELLEETSTFSQEMSEQLSQFASFLDRFLNR